MKRRIVLFIALTLGLGWAVRGHFGHEQGAAWAGGLAALAVVAVSGRSDWYRRLPFLGALGAVGWGLGGMMSYGIIVGYGRSTDYGNAFYGLLMLTVVGGLYGFLGGGLLGLGLESSEERHPDWPRLLTEMVAGGFIFWGFLIYQLGWRMTPPRSELWAGCLGAAVALSWYAWRNSFHRTLRLAWITALGAGFGFSLGNFFQTLGSASGLAINWWNVMEFTLGFSGGMGLAYGVYTTDWPRGRPASPATNGFGLLVLLFLIPGLNLDQAFTPAYLERVASRLGYTNTTAFAYVHILAAGLVGLVVFAAGTAGWRRVDRRGNGQARRFAGVAVLSYGAYYIFMSNLKVGVFGGISGVPEQFVYWGLLLAVGVLWFGGLKRAEPFPLGEVRTLTWREWVLSTAGLVAVCALLALILVHTHGPLPGAHQRF